MGAFLLGLCLFELPLRTLFHEKVSLTSNLERFKKLSYQLHSTIGEFTFAPLRNVLVNTILRRVHPQTLQMSESAIPRIVNERFYSEPSNVDIESFTDAAVRDLLKGLKQLQIGELRNDVIHHGAYRPQRAEVEKCRGEEIDLLHDAERALRPYGFDKRLIIRAGSA
jgi:hypothetical protein